MSNSVVRGAATVALAIALVGGAELTGLASSSVARAQGNGDGWRWSITPYLWGTELNADVRLRGGQEVGSELQFDDILDKLDFAAQVHLEGRRNAWGMFVDATYLALSDDTTHGPISADTDIDTGIYEVAATFTPGGEVGQFTAFAGARIIDLSLEMRFSLPEPLPSVQRTSDKSYADFMIGGRLLHPFSDRWLLELRGDIGAGDSESSWNALATVGWRFGNDLDNAVLLGWRHMELEVEEGGRETDVTLDGPIAGVLFSF